MKPNKKHKDSVAAIQDEIDILKEHLIKKLKRMAVPMVQVEFSRENYNNLFPDSKVTTPIGVIKLGGHQFKKLESEKRQEYLGGMYQTLTDPVTITNQEDQKGKAKIFSKSFIHKSKEKDGIISVIVDIGGQNVSISTHPRKLKKIIEEIKKTADLIYEKPESGRTAGNDPKDLTNNDTQL